MWLQERGLAEPLVGTAEENDFSGQYNASKWQVFFTAGAEWVAEGPKLDDRGGGYSGLYHVVCTNT